MEVKVTLKAYNRTNNQPIEHTFREATLVRPGQWDFVIEVCKPPKEGSMVPIAVAGFSLSEIIGYTITEVAEG